MRATSRPRARLLARPRCFGGRGRAGVTACHARHPFILRLATRSLLCVVLGPQLLTHSRLAGAASNPPHPHETLPRDDPDAAPMMVPPHGQPRGADQRLAPTVSATRHDVRRLQLTIAPVYASFWIPFQGRPTPTRGVGIAGELDVQVWRWLWLRMITSYTAHPVDEQRTINDRDELIRLGRAGNIEAIQLGGSVVYGLDIGPILPLIEVGLGALWIRSPQFVQSGQAGGACRQDRSCDTGLSCGSDNICRTSPVPELHVGLALDFLFFRVFTFGVQLRYYALLGEPTNIPIYLLAGARLGARF